MIITLTHAQRCKTRIKYRRTNEKELALEIPIVKMEYISEIIKCKRLVDGRYLSVYGGLAPLSERITVSGSVFLPQVEIVVVPGSVLLSLVECVAVPHLCFAVTGGDGGCSR